MHSEVLWRGIDLGNGLCLKHLFTAHSTYPAKILSENVHRGGQRKPSSSGRCHKADWEKVNDLKKRPNRSKSDKLSPDEAVPQLRAIGISIIKTWFKNCSFITLKGWRTLCCEDYKWNSAHFHCIGIEAEFIFCVFYLSWYNWADSIITILSL